MNALVQMIAVVLCLLCCSGNAAAVSYAYEASAPLAFHVGQTRAESGATIADVSYRSGDTIIHAALVTPERPVQRMPAVLFVHWLGEAATTNRTEFLSDAMWLARRGVVSLLPDQPWSQRDWFEKIRSTATDAADSRAEVISLRRALDALLALPGTDPARLAYVGHDFGAMYGALLAGVDSRPSSYVYMSPTVTFAEWFLLDTHRPPADPAGYAAQLAAFDIPASLARASDAASLLQFGSHDEFVSSDKAHAFAAAVGGNKTVRTYDAGHDLRDAAATDDRRAWLAARLQARTSFLELFPSGRVASRNNIIFRREIGDRQRYDRP